MNMNKKLVVCIILALTIGIASVVPLALIMTPAKAQTLDTPWFNPDLAYAYWAYNTTTAADSANLMAYNEHSAFGLNFSVNPDAINTMVNTRIEYCLLRIYSDLGPIENTTYFFGANFGNETNPPTFMYQNDNLNLTTLGNGGGSFLCNFNGTLPTGFTNGGTKSYMSSVGENVSLPQAFLNLQNANRVYLDVSRIGYVTFDGNSTTVTIANSGVLQHVELTKNGDSFYYGTVPDSAIAQYFSVPT